MMDRMLYPIPIVRLFVLDDQKRILLLQRSEGAGKGDWCLPGGKVPCGETVEDALRRELKEETGLDVVSSRFLFLQDCLPAKEGEIQYLNLYFVVTWNGSVTLNDESLSFTWSPEDDKSGRQLVFGNQAAVEHFWSVENRG